MWYCKLRIRGHLNPLPQPLRCWTGGQPGVMCTTPSDFPAEAAARGGRPQASLEVVEELLTISAPLLRSAGGSAQQPMSVTSTALRSVARRADAHHVVKLEALGVRDVEGAGPSQR